MKCVFINSAKQVLERETCENFEDMQTLLGGYFEIAAWLPNGDTLYVNSEALIQADVDYNAFIFQGNKYFGHGLIISHDSEGNIQTHQTGLRSISKIVSFVDMENIYLTDLF